MKDQGTLHSDSKDKAELLNNQFQSVFTTENNSVLPDMSREPYPAISDIEITVNGVSKLLQQLKVNKANGPDGIPNRIRKETESKLQQYTNSR